MFSHRSPVIALLAAMAGHVDASPKASASLAAAAGTSAKAAGRQRTQE